MPDENDIVFNEYSLDIFSIIDRLWTYFFGGAGSAGGTDAATSAALLLADVLNWLSTFWGVITVLSWIVSLLLIWGLIYAYILGSKLGDVVSAILTEQEEMYGKTHNRNVKNKRWEAVQEHMKSARTSDWRLAIIEADIILEELLNNIGLVGDTVGEKLKNASTTSFSTLDQAWRAHNVRNRITHEGAGYDFTIREAQEVITQYKMVFEEFDFI